MRQNQVVIIRFPLGLEEGRIGGGSSEPGSRLRLYWRQGGAASCRNGRHSMYERFTDRAKLVIRLAQQEAVDRGQWDIDSEHVLLALLKEGNGLAVDVLLVLGIDIQDVCSELDRRMDRGAKIVVEGKLAQTLRTKKIIENSMDEARSLRHKYVGTEHFLLGLLREQDGIAGRVLSTFGVTLDDARRETVQLVSSTVNFRTAEDLGLS
jgi:ATP-dependent Clp protease ATP-binding subunit ClpC